MKRRTILLSLLILLPAVSINLPAQSGESEKILITEFMAINNNTLADEDGDYPDWIEIFNPGPNSINLAGWYLTDNPGNLDKWGFPGMSLEAGSYLLVFASGKDRRDPAKNLHTGFSLSGSGEYLAIIEPDQVSISHSYSPMFPAQRADVSYGLVSGQESYMTEPTPGMENTLGDYILRPVFSRERGFYKQPFDVELSVGDAGLEIYYTLDGSRPSKSEGSLYTGPVTIQTTTPLSAVAVNASGGASEVVTHTYLFTDSIVKQPELPAGYPDVWGNFKYIDPPPPADYEMDPEVCEDPACKDLMDEALTSIPSLCIVTDIGNLFSTIENELTGGIYIFTGNSAAGSAGKDWERQVSAEYFDPSGGSQFQINCGLRIHGGNSRVPDNSQKHSLRLVFRSEFGPTKLNYNLFEHRDATNKFNTLILRAGYNFSWSHNNIQQLERALMVRDPFAKNTQLDMGSPSPHSRYVHLYLNGLYWGIYTITEKLNNDFMESYLKGSEEEFDVVKDHNGIVDGDQAAWTATLNQSGAGLAGNEAYQKIQGNNPDGTANPTYPMLLDVDNLIDYMMFNIYIGNGDWDHNNWIAGRNRVDPEYGFRFFSWDGETSLVDLNENLVNENNDGNPSGIYTQLRANEEFRLRFADRIQMHFFNTGALTTEACMKRFLELTNQLDKAIIAESARWGDYRRDLHVRNPGASLYTRDDFWLVEKEDLEENYFPLRSGIVLEQFRSAGLYPDIDAPAFSQYGGAIGQRIELQITSPEGQIYYSLDGGDPRETGGSVSPAHALLYSLPLQINGPVTVKARAKSGNTWSALTMAEFIAGEPVSVNHDVTGDMLLSTSYPNPFSGTTRIAYTLPGDGHVEIIVLNMDGRLIKLLHNSWQSAGEHSVEWNAEDCPAGMYFYRIRFENKMLTGKMILNR